MNLPNFINFDPFNKLRRQMRTNKLGHYSLEDWRKKQPQHAEAAATPAKPPAKTAGKAGKKKART